MRFSFRRRWLFACCAATLLFMPPAGFSESKLETVANRDAKSGKQADPLTAATLVVFNDSNAESVNLALYYAKKRGIPLDHVVGLSCPLTEEISRAEYDESIVRPLRRIFKDRGWWKLRKSPEGQTQISENKIRFIAVIRGMPLKIAKTADYDGDKKEGPPAMTDHNEAAVDSEMASLGYFTRQISGGLNNPYYRSFARFLNARLPPLMLVCRLDAADAPTVRRMIDDSIETEQKRLWGFAYIDKVGPHAEGDEWLKKAANDSRFYGLPVIEDDSPGTFPAGYPMRHAAVYFGWYAGDANGPLARDDFRFEKGAVAVHIHSFSAESLRNPRQHWAAPLLAHGAAATLGNVYEPYLTLTPHLDIFNARLLAGYTFAESAYASTPVLSWMTTFIGDPLYRPFRPATDLSGETPKAAEFVAYREGARLWFSSDRPAGEKQLRETADRLHSGVVYEGLGLLQISADDREAALDSFRLAQKFYTRPDDLIRVTIHEVRLFLGAGKKTDAMALAKRQIQANPRLPGCEVLRGLLPDLAPKETGHAPTPPK